MSWSARGCAVIVALSTVVVAAPTIAAPTAPHHARTDLHSRGTAASPLFPIGTPDASAPSGMGPPAADALAGYYRSYVTAFTSNALPSGWETFLGKPGGDPGAQWADTHVTVNNGLLTLYAFQDPAFNNAWVTGGLCQCSVARTYGAYFVRSRLTGPGPTQVELLWPTTGWPPEIDFSETYGGTNYSMATDHFTAANKEIHNRVYLDVTQWHTWGVIWNPTSITYTVDGRIWGQITNAAAIPHQPMTLDLQQQTWCLLGRACPASPQELQVNWVTEYTQSVQGAYVLRPFITRSVALTPALKTQIVRLAGVIRTNGQHRVILVGYGDSSSVSRQARRFGSRRAEAVKSFLLARLAILGVASVSITTTDSANAVPAALTPASSSGPHRVVALLTP
jgi:Glycosyl hydrolases family 16